MKWVTRANCHVDRMACAWLIQRFVDREAEFMFVEDPEDAPDDATAFDTRGARFSHHAGECTFEQIMHHYDLDDPALRDIGRIVHEADLLDERYDAPEAHGLDVLIRGLSMVRSDSDMLEICGPLFDGLYEYRQRANLLGREPS